MWIVVNINSDGKKNAVKTIPQIGSNGNTRQLIAAGPQDLGNRYLYNYSVSDMIVGINNI